MEVHMKENGRTNKPMAVANRVSQIIQYMKGNLRILCSMVCSLAKQCAHILSFSSHTGQGKLTFADGTIMEGSWEDGNIVHGRQLKYSDSFLYVGDFKDSMFHGKGKSPLLRT